MSGTQIHCDTHVLVWLYNAEIGKLSDTGRRLIDERELIMSPMVELELTYLHEIGRTNTAGAVVFADLEQRVGLRRSENSFAAVGAAGAAQSWTRDPFDRLIVGDASASACQLLTKDQHMLDNFELAIW